MPLLFCTTCTKVVPQTYAQCPYCNAGFVPQLACTNCQRTVDRGFATCSTCEPTSRPAQPSLMTSQAPPPPPGGELVPHYGVSRPAQPHDPYETSPSAGAMTHGGGYASSLPMVPIRMPSPVPDRYVQNRFGVKAEVFLSGRDAEIMTKMLQVAALVQALAEEMNGFVGHMPTTREAIKGCRQLALTLQEEVELRRGPQGG